MTRLCLFAVVLAVSIAGVFTYSKNYGHSYSNCIKARYYHRCGWVERLSGFRTVEGVCNNLRYSTWGSTRIPLKRCLKADYSDSHKIDVPRGYPGFSPKLPAPNQVSQKLFGVTKKTHGNKQHLSTLLMTFGQFLDHDITDTPSQSCQVKDCNAVGSFRYPCFSMLFDDTYSKCTPFGRSRPVCRYKKGVREQMNLLTSYVDGSQIYSPERKQFQALRKLDGSGELKIKSNGLMELDNNIKNCHTLGGCSLVGDHRGDENIALHSMHTLWVREHNRIAKQLKEINSHWGGERLFQNARKIASAVYQHIVFKEWLPLVVPPFKYVGYRKFVNPGIINAFATASFRFGHSLIPNEFHMLDKNFDSVNKPTTLQDAFFNRLLVDQYGIETIMYGLVGNKSEEVDTEFAFSVARRLFVTPGKDEYHDLTARNIQRGRDHGIPTYGAYRRWCRLPTIRTWEQLKNIMPEKAVHSFKELYPSPYHIDLFAAGMAENHLITKRHQSIVGPTFACIIRRQFKRLQWGDRFYYRARGMFTRAQRLAIYKTRMSTVLCNNLKGVVSLPKKAFLVPGKHNNKRVECNNIPKLDMWAWKENHLPYHGGKNNYHQYKKDAAAAKTSNDDASNLNTKDILKELDLEDAEMSSSNDVQGTTTTPTTTTKASEVTGGSEGERKSGLVVEENYNPESEEGEATIDDFVEDEENDHDLGDLVDSDETAQTTSSPAPPTTTTTTDTSTTEISALEEYNVEGENIDEEEDDAKDAKTKKDQNEDNW